MGGVVGVVGDLPCDPLCGYNPVSPRTSGALQLRKEAAAGSTALPQLAHPGSQGRKARAAAWLCAAVQHVPCSPSAMVLGLAHGTTQPAILDSATSAPPLVPPGSAAMICAGGGGEGSESGEGRERGEGFKNESEVRWTAR